jgi:hypothetical protein
MLRRYLEHVAEAPGRMIGNMRRYCCAVDNQDFDLEANP